MSNQNVEFQTEIKANIKNKFKDKITLKTTQVGEEKEEVANISTYTNKYPALKEKLGYTLVNI